MGEFLYLIVGDKVVEDVKIDVPDGHLQSSLEREVGFGGQNHVLEEGAVMGYHDLPDNLGLQVDEGDQLEPRLQLQVEVHMAIMAP